MILFLFTSTHKISGNLGKYLKKEKKSFKKEKKEHTSKVV